MSLFLCGGSIHTNSSHFIPERCSDQRLLQADSFSLRSCLPETGTMSQFLAELYWAFDGAEQISRDSIQETHLHKLPTELRINVIKNLLPKWAKDTIYLAAHCSNKFMGTCASHPDIFSPKTPFHTEVMDEMLKSHKTQLILQGFDSDSLSHAVRTLDWLSKISPSSCNVDICFWSCNRHLTLGNLMKWAFLCWHFRNTFSGRIVSSSQPVCNVEHSERNHERMLLRKIAKHARSVSSTCDQDGQLICNQILEAVRCSNLPPSHFKYETLLSDSKDLAMEEVQHLWRQCQPGYTPNPWHIGPWLRYNPPSGDAGNSAVHTSPWKYGWPLLCCNWGHGIDECRNKTCLHHWPEQEAAAVWEPKEVAAVRGLPPLPRLWRKRAQRAVRWWDYNRNEFHWLLVHLVTSSHFFMLHWLWTWSSGTKGVGGVAWTWRSGIKGIGDVLWNWLVGIGLILWTWLVKIMAIIAYWEGFKSARMILDALWVSECDPGTWTGHGSGQLWI
ncbi:hypothetical protein K461DRAFT_19420 [Myriangium duriaei CBS 260.36]|uniref:Uncharacterized protein n=1 Tax=Myriangium duriaei CBS 260.36 TaxID=1168546 RepID=A0A9P4MLN4_9PEZI|nr:hypothetical protein K461DRAFT_19420 [Myriangium duriaei CBS 260.36]